MLKEYLKVIKRDILVKQDIEELKKWVIQLKKELFNLRFAKKVGSVKSMSNFSKIRKNVARIKTEIFSRGVRY